ncbi:hypothetical protein D9M72_557960 [compost metagenome]
MNALPEEQDDGCRKVQHRRSQGPFRPVRLEPREQQHAKAGRKGNRQREKAGHEGRRAVFDAEDGAKRSLIVSGGNKEIDDEGQRGQDDEIARTHASQERHSFLRGHSRQTEDPEREHALRVRSAL